MQICESMSRTEGVPSSGLCTRIGKLIWKPAHYKHGQKTKIPCRGLLAKHVFPRYLFCSSFLILCGKQVTKSTIIFRRVSPLYELCNMIGLISNLNHFCLSSAPQFLLWFIILFIAFYLFIAPLHPPLLEILQLNWASKKLRPHSPPPPWSKWLPTCAFHRGTTLSTYIHSYIVILKQDLADPTIDMDIFNVKLWHHILKAGYPHLHQPTTNSHSFHTHIPSVKKKKWDNNDFYPPPPFDSVILTCVWAVLWSACPWRHCSFYLGMTTCLARSAPQSSLGHTTDVMMLQTSLV